MKKKIRKYKTRENKKENKKDKHVKQTNIDH